MNRTTRSRTHQRTTVYLREKLGVDPHPNDWTGTQWASANNARPTSKFHAQTTEFPPDKAARAIRALTAAVKNQHNRRLTTRTAATINPRNLLRTKHQQGWQPPDFRKSQEMDEGNGRSRCPSAVKVSRWPGETLGRARRDRTGDQTL
jgi:uncharacterized protein with von Willebrand factor type A (vWA) domain